MAVILPFDEILHSLDESCDDFSSLSVRKQLVQIITMYFNCYVMKMLIKSGLADRNSKMYLYITQNKLNDIGDEAFQSTGNNRFKRMILAAKSMNNKVGTAAQTISTIMDVVDAFNQNDYEDACAEMKGILETHKVLLLVDTLNEYDLRDIRIVTCIKSLIATCFEYYNHSEQNHIYVKISIPSEIHTHLIEQLPGKQQGNTVVIRWTNNDLIKMIAIRLLSLSESGKAKPIVFSGKYNYCDFYDCNLAATSNAKRLIYEFLPKDCPTSLDYYFDTISYCIRHTLKKPRELIAIFNAFISKICEKNDFQYFINNSDKISDVIHSTQESMIVSAISMYSTSYPNILSACDIVLNHQTFYFKGKDIENRLKEAEAEIHDKMYDKNDIKRILLESGLVGKINEISNMTPKNPDDGEYEKTSIRIIKARFEYQVKGHLSLNREDYYVLHPMCYEHFSCNLDTKTIVYPDTSSDDSDWVQTVKLKKWVTV